MGKLKTKINQREMKTEVEALPEQYQG